MKALRMILLLAALTALMSCARSRSLVVLLPDADGGVGSLQVETSQGFIALDKSFQSITAGGGNAPESPRVMARREVDAKFSQALAAEPPQRFRLKKHTYYCHINSVDLTPESQSEWTGTIRRLVATPPGEIYVIGHADRVGTEKYNQKLSEKRAQAIRQNLVSKGLSSKIIVISFMGESKPQIDTPDEVEEPRNRRVEIILKYAK